MKIKQRSKQAFTLPEVIVAFSVLVMVIVACTNLLVTVIRSNTENVNTLVAYGLAEEGIEAVRNIRDSNWLLGADFQGKIGGNSECAWGSVCLPSPGQVYDYVLDFNNFPASANGPDVKQVSELVGIVPFRLDQVDLTNPQQLLRTKLYIPVRNPGVRSTESAVWYRPCPLLSCSTTVESSPFSRYVEIEAFASPKDPRIIQKYLVSSVVSWNESNRSKEVRLTTELTDWK